MGLFEEEILVIIIWDFRLFSSLGKDGLLLSNSMEGDCSSFVCFI